MISYKLSSMALVSLIVITLFGCNSNSEKAQQPNTTESQKPTENKPTKPAQPLTDEFKSYWYAGKAEITSYNLEQARYGELREGTAVLIYVTEDFLPDAQVKADQARADNISVLKLNATKEFNTGIYPYHIMQSTFYPVSNNQHALKVTASVQEWCGQVYAQINNKAQFEVQAHSYFQTEGDQSFKLDKTYLENELWTQLRINPKSLPTGSLKLVPSLEYLRLKHKDMKAYTATASLADSTYNISYPELKRTLSIEFNAKFPHDITRWEETYPDNNSGELFTTTAVKLTTLIEPYWQQNKNEDANLRGQLGLE